MTRILLVLTLLVSIPARAGSPKHENMPLWLKKKLKSPQPPIEIEKYIFKKETTYLLAFVCCDQGTRELYDSKGKLICKLPESFAGLDDSACPGFIQDGKHLGSILKKQ